MVRGRLLLLNQRRPQSKWLRHHKEEAPKPKPKNPLDLLPLCKMVLDDWKRLYSTQSATSMRLLLKVSGTCMNQRITLCGSLVLLLQVSRQHTVILDPAQGWCVSPRDGSR